MNENEIREKAKEITEKVKQIVSDGSASRILIKRKGEVLLNLSLGAGIIGAAVGLTAAPFAALTAALVSFGLDCEIEIEKKDGSVINLNDTSVGIKLGEIKDSASEKVKDFFARGDAFNQQNAYTQPPEEYAEESAEKPAEEKAEENNEE